MTHKTLSKEHVRDLHTDLLALLVVHIERSSLNASDLSAYLRDAAEGMANTATLIGDSRERLASRLRVELRHFLDAAKG